MNPAGLLAGIASYNLVQNTLLIDRGYVTGNVAVTSGALAWARRAGSDWDDLGLDPETSVLGFGVGAVVSGVAAGLVWAVRDTGLARSLLADERVAGLGRDEMWRRVLIRFPLGTALFEEVVFRGVVPSAFPTLTPWRSDLISATAFAFWHVIPASRTLAANPRARSWGRGRKTAAVIAGCVTAGLGGLALSGLRRSSSSLVAPWLAHTTFNALTLLVAARPGDTTDRGQSASSPSSHSEQRPTRGSKLS